MSIGENIKKFRLEKGWTQKKLGEECEPKIAESTIRRYELGKLNPKLETVQKIAEALNVSVTELDSRINNEIDSLEFELHRLQHEKFEEFKKFPLEEVFSSEKWNEVNHQYESKEKELCVRLKKLAKDTPKQHLYETTGETLKRLRNKNAVSLKEIFQSTGIPETLIKRYENDERTLSLDDLSKIADYYGVSMDYIDTRVSAYGFIATTSQDKLLETLMFCYELLNEEGQEKAIEQIKLLLLVPQYCAPEPEEDEPTSN